MFFPKMFFRDVIAMPFNLVIFHKRAILGGNSCAISNRNGFNMKVSSVNIALDEGILHTLNLRLEISRTTRF